MTHNLSPITFIVFLTFCLIVSAQDLTVSKDSIKVYNSLLSSSADEVIFTSHSSAPIRLDSAYVLITEMDTVGLSEIFRIMKIEAAWKGNTFGTQQYFWTMNNVGLDNYKLTKREFLPPTDTPLAFSGNGTTSRMFFLQIGTCFICDRMPIYPKYLRGTIRLFFSNGQVVELRLYSQDLRTAVKPKGFSRLPSTVNCKPSTLSLSYRYLANGRRVNATSKPNVSKKQAVRTYVPKDGR